MNLFFRICVAVYSFVSMILFGIIMIAPFGDKTIMSKLLDYIEVNLYQSNAYDVVVFIVGLVFFLLTLTILTSGLRGKRSAKYICLKTDEGLIRISTNSIENIALAMSKRFQGVKDAKAKVLYKNDNAEISVKIQVFTDVNVPALCKGIQERVKESVENSMEIKVSGVTVSVDGVTQQEA